MAREYIAELFMDGEDQAVRLPDACRFEGTEVRVRRSGDAVILEPVSAAEPRQWSEGFWEHLDHLITLSDDFEVPEPLPPCPHRDAWLDEIGES
jgi:virulence-associated protein VagC